MASFLDMILGGQQAASQSPVVMAEDIPVQAPIQRKGLFGVKGTLRDILGTLGDGLLVGSDADPVYAPQRQRERQSDALTHFMENPLEAIQRLNDAGFPQQAQDLYKDYSVLQNQNAQQRIRADDYKSRVWGRAAGMLATATPENWGAVREQIGKYLTARGVEAPYALPDKYDADQIEGIRRGSYPVDKQLDDEALSDYRDRSLGLRERQIKTAESRAANATATSQAKLAETIRHNKENERLGGARIEVSKTKGKGKTPAAANSTAGAPPPRKVGDRITGPGGKQYYSPDGKKWVSISGK